MVLMLRGMQKIMAGSMVRVMYGPSGEKLQMMIWHISIRQ
jgi:hypothetical protein